KRYVVIAGILLVSVGSADAGLFGRKAKAPAESAPVTAMTLNAVEIDGSRVILRTSGAPAYTSYSPTPGVFVVDLTGTSRDAAVSIPAALPPAVTSIAAEEVTEMGNRLTRITFRLSSPMHLEVAAIDKAVAVIVPATAIDIQTAPSAVEALPAVVPTAQTSEPVVETIEPISEPIIEPVAEPIAEQISAPTPAPAVAKADPSLPRARTVRDINARTAGDAVEVRITGDGALKYKAFRLENPTRLVIDLDGVKNGVKNTAVTVDDDVVKRVRVAQFQPTVARVVIDLTRKAEYSIDTDGDHLLVAFGDTSSMPAPAPTVVATREPEPAPVVVKETPKPAQTAVSVFDTAPKPAAVPVKQPAADIPTQVPTIAENVPSWKMPEPVSKGARSVINPPQEVAPPTGGNTQENVFANPTTPQPTITGGPGPQNLGTRQLSGGRKVFTGEPISMNLKGADLTDVLATFADITGLNMAIDPGVRGSVTVDFADVPWDQALDIILRQNSLTYVLEGNVMRIGTVDRIAAETAATRRLDEEERLNVPLTTLSFPISYARAGEVAGLLRELASPRARILVDPRTNQLIISEIPQYLQTMQNLIATIDVPTRQVTIEARIVESSRTFAQQWGFDWGFGGDLDPSLGTGTGLVFPNRIGFTGGPFEFGAGRNVIDLHLTDVLGSFTLDFALSAAETQGYIKVVSAPRVTTQDNQAAQITSGFQIPYQTRVNFTTTVTYLDATLSLNVTPQITDAGTVIMEISVQKNEPAPGLAIAGAAGTPLTTRQARTRLMVRDGGTAVIAGIFQTRDNDSETRMPFVHNIPIIGALFRSHDITTAHDEL
ncbi:MAG TPA: type IV pilus secretin PilQ, partial [Thermoanaerobaculia bacterium]|nr:type IV pilus secretin PilQ [Thermoanaerobaculia bacterium]